MVRTLVIAALVGIIVVAAVCAGLAAPARAFIPTIDPVKAKVWLKAGDGEALGVAPVGTGTAAIVCGYETSASNGKDVCVRRVGSNGWTRYWDGAAHKDDKGGAVAVSSNGAAYVVGSTQTSGGGAMVLLKYSPTGRRLWAKTWTGTSTWKNPAGKFVRIDSQGDILVVGNVSIGSGPQVFIGKYHPDGSRAWLHAMTSGHMSTANDVCLSGSGIYIAGEYQATSPGDADCMLAKYSTAGTLSWSKVMGYTAGLWDQFSGVCRRPEGGVYCAGTGQTSGSDSDGLIYMFKPDGSHKLLSVLGRFDSLYTELQDVLVAKNGDIVVGGYWELSSTTYAMYAAGILPATGVKDWSNTISSSSHTARIDMLAMTSGGTIGGTGFWYRASNVQQVVSLFMDGDGGEVGWNLWPSPSSVEPWAKATAAKGDTIWTVGSIPGPSSGLDAFARSYAP